MQLADLTRPELIFPDLPGSDRPTILRALADRVHEAGLVDDADTLYERLFEREQLGSTALGGGVAVPHCKLEGISSVLLAIGLTRRDVDFGAADDEPVRTFFLIVSPEEDPAAHLQALAAISKWIKADQHASRIAQLEDRGAIYSFLQAEYA